MAMQKGGYTDSRAPDTLELSKRMNINKKAKQKVLSY